MEIGIWFARVSEVWTCRSPERHENNKVRVTFNFPLLLNKAPEIMKLYKRDYSKLTRREELEWTRLKKLEIVRRSGRFTLARSRFHQYPKAARHFEHLFPNNYLDPIELKKTRGLNAKLTRFRKLLASPQVSERGILTMIRQERAHFIVGSILKDNFDFGHHEAYLFPEFPLGTSHKADYLLVGRNSGGYEFVFVEFEAPSKNITTRNGDLGKAFRSGQSQVADWDSWLAANYQTLSEEFRKQKKSGMDLPEEFTRFDPSRVHFVIVAGRRGDFKEKTYRMRRGGRKKGGPLILHYDNIADFAEAIIGNAAY
jgi:antiviral defense system Shedu protein SduA